MVAQKSSQTHQRYAAISSHNPEDAVPALRLLKNELIGHQDRKQEAIAQGLIPVLLSILREPSGANGEAQVQAAVVLASLCQGDNFNSSGPSGIPYANVGLQKDQIVESVLDCVVTRHANSALMLPCLRALSLLVQAGVNTSIIWDKRFAPLTEILQTAASSTKITAVQQATYVASLLATYTEDTKLGNNDAEIILGVLIGIVVNTTQLGLRSVEAGTPQAKLLEAALAALSAFTKSRAAFATQLAAAGRLSEYRCSSDDVPMINTLLRLVRHQSNSVRLGSATCLINLFKHATIPRKLHKEVTQSVLPILVRLFDDAALKSQASFALTDLVKDSDDMQRAACDAGAIQRLATILQPKNSAQDEKTVESALLALAALTLQKDEYRKLVIDSKMVPLIVAAMSHASPQVRAAACQCARSLSRSVAMLRTSLIDAGVATAVFNLMQDSDLSVKTSATAAVCNLVLDFSPMRKIILDSGIIALLGKLSQEASAELRLNAIWALKHIVYAADIDIRESLLNDLTPALLLGLCDDHEIAVQEQACEVIRNLVCGRPENIDLLIDNIGIERLADFLIRKLNSRSPEIVVSAVYSLVHLAAGSERHRTIVMQRSSILEALHVHLGSEVEEIRIGAVWTIINLTWQEDETTASERRARVNALESLGFAEKLRSIEFDRSLDVRERVKTAMAQMDIQPSA